MSASAWSLLSEALRIQEAMNYQKLSRQKNMDRYGTASGRADRDISGEINRMTGAPKAPPKASPSQVAAAKAFFANKETGGSKPAGGGENPLLKPSAASVGQRVGGPGKAVKPMAAPGASIVGAEPSDQTKAAVQPRLIGWEEMVWDDGDTRRAMGAARKELERLVPDPDERKRALGWIYKAVSKDGAFQ